jgi:hypothetical protein
LCIQYVSAVKLFYKALHPLPTASADECAAAAEIYDCGKKKAPEITNAIQDKMEKISSAAPVGVRRIFIFKHHCFIFT